MTSVAIGVDIGGTKISAGVVSADGSLESRAEMPSDISDPGALCAQIAALVAELGTVDVLGLGIGAAGLVDHRTGHYFYGPNTGLRDCDLAQMAADVTGMRVRLDNDANCAAWAEHRFGAGEGCDHFLCVTLGTGIGGGFVLDGRPYRGAHGGAAEIGHIVMDPDGPLCGCGQRGCWEQLASGLALERIGKDAFGKKTKGQDVTRMARDGDATALELIATTARWVGLGLGSLVNVLEPERIAIAGGVTRDWDLFADTAHAAMVEQMEAHDRRPVPQLLAAELGHDAGIVGAALLLLEE